MTTQTPEQKIAELEAKIQLIKARNRKLDTAQKIVVGGTLLAAARRSAAIRDLVIAELDASVTRPIDKKRVAPLLEELRNLPRQ